MGNHSSSNPNYNTSSEAFSKVEDELSQYEYSDRRMSDSGESESETTSLMKIMYVGSRANQMKVTRRRDHESFLEGRRKSSDPELYKTAPPTQAYKKYGPPSEENDTQNVNLLFKRCQISSGDFAGQLVTVIGVTSTKATVSFPDGIAMTLPSKLLKIWVKKVSFSVLDDSAVLDDIDKKLHVRRCFFSLANLEDSPSSGILRTPPSFTPDAEDLSSYTTQNNTIYNTFAANFARPKRSPKPTRKSVGRYLQELFGK